MILRSPYLFPIVWCISTICAIHLGSIPLKAQDYIHLVDQLWQFVTTGSVEWTSTSYVLWYLRIPQALFAGALGAALALAGSLTQGLFRNPLADPGVLGISSGAAASVAIGIVFLSQTSLITYFSSSQLLWFIPLLAFTGGLFTCAFLNQISKWIQASSIAGLLLTGIAINALLGAIIGFSNFLATDSQLRSLAIWSMGSISGITWEMCFLLICVVGYGRWIVRIILQQMNALALGESVVRHLGIHYTHIRRFILIHVALITAMSVAFSGLIGFIGLIAPHIARTILGADHRLSTPAAMWIGAILVLWADILARIIMPPIALPIGIFTALLGAPFFMVLLWQMRAKGRL